MNTNTKVFFLVYFASCLLIGCGSSGDDSKDSETSTPEGTDTDDTESDDTESDDTESEVFIPDNYYSVTVNGKAVPVERISKFTVPVNYVVMDYPGESIDLEITPKESFTDYTLSPKSRDIGETSDGESLSFSIDAPIYMVLQIPDKERLFILIDPPEENPPGLDDSDVKNIMDYDGIDNTGETDVTEIIQAAVDEASGADKNILYFPKGTYATQMINLKSDMTLYLARGANLQNVTPGGKLISHPAGLANIEGCSFGLIGMNGVTNAKLKGRGMLDGNGVELRTYDVEKQESIGQKMFLVKIENSSDCEVEGIVSRDSAFWNTMIYRSDNITINNYKVISNRLEDNWNERDGVDFDNCTDSKLYNAFLYTGDDCMAVKSDDIPEDADISGLPDPSTDEDYIAVDNISHEKIVCFSGSSACKVGTKTLGDTMSNISFKDVDVVTANRALVIDAVDTAQISGTTFENIRIENATGRLVDFNMDPESITWRKVVGTCTVNDTTVKDVSADVSKECRLTGDIHDWNEEDVNYGNAYYIDGVEFTNFSIEGNVIESVDDSNANFNVNDYATNITFNP